MDFYSRLNNEILICEVCPRRCHLKKGQKGFCKIRVNTGSKIEHLSYSYITAPALDPIEKKPLYHFYPGSKVLSFGTYGCNMGCRFCQNWHITKSDNDPFLLCSAEPAKIVNIACELGCKSIAFTYNDPVIFLEYALDVTSIAQSKGIKCIAISAGYANKDAGGALFSKMDAVNLDLKGITEEFYSKNCLADITAVLDTIKYVHGKTKAHLELTNLIIEGENDNPQDITNMCKWIVQNLGKNVPLHFSAFHGAYKFKNRKQTSYDTLLKAYNIAKEAGINYVYLGNISDKATSATYCKSCSNTLIERQGFNITAYNLDGLGCCKNCKTPLDGVFI